MGDFKVKNPRPLFRRSLRQAPGHPRGERILVRELPPESVTEGGIELADEGRQRCMAGHIVSAGEKALDIMYDGGDEVGDLILYAKYAGVVQEWQHIVGPDVLTCAHDGARDMVTPPSGTLDALRRDETKAEKKAREERDRKWQVAGGHHDNISLRECRGCGTLIVSERLIVMNVEDILMNVDAQERIEAGQMVVIRGETAEGQTQHVLERKMKEAA